MKRIRTRKVERIIALFLVVTFLEPVTTLYAAGDDFKSLKALFEVNRDAARNSDDGMVCNLGDGKFTTSFIDPPANYVGTEGDLWKEFGSEYSSSQLFIWDGQTWRTEGETFELYRGDAVRRINNLRAGVNGLRCKFGANVEINSFKKTPPVGYSGVKGDVFYSVDQNNEYTLGQYIWSGSKWVANPDNEFYSLNSKYQIAVTAAIASKTGTVCTYGKNRDTTSSYYEVPPSSYKGAVADAWVVSGNGLDTYWYWNGKKWISLLFDNSPEMRGMPDNETVEGSQLKKKNDALQLSARKSKVGEVCKSNGLTGTQRVGVNPPASYSGKVGDKWNYLDPQTLEFSKTYYWNGKKWLTSTN